MGRGEDREAGAAGPLADARGRRRDGGVPGRDAAANVTGQTINVDGGFVMR